ncbi:MAG: hypothetical protein ACW99J_18470 [Candidatus Thorarchaeota archaeon]|jgi:hypothetical protein
MIDKFIEKYREFDSHEDLTDLSSEARIALFGVFLQALQLEKPSVPQPQSQPAPASSGNRRISKPNRAATSKQKGFIRTLIRQGKLDDDVDVSNLTVATASALIDQGVKSQPKPAAVPEPEPEGEFTGSYAHSSGGVTSSAHFWE